MSDVAIALTVGRFISNNGTDVAVITKITLTNILIDLFHANSSQKAPTSDREKPKARENPMYGFGNGDIVAYNNAKNP
jgi:hypothetical protein